MNFAKKKLYELNSTILITGETGCGKSRLASEIHRNSIRAKDPFIIANLATLAEEIIESELFGHVKGSFTGALADRKGLCEVTGRGILFLDEVAELSLGAQKKLLHILEERKFTPVGSSYQKPFLGQIIAATNRELEQMVKEGSFRADLYYRLRVFEFKMVPLRDDPAKLKGLLTEILEKKGIKQQYWTKLENAFSNYHWPGNVRELINSIEYFRAIGELPYWISSSSQRLEEIATYGEALSRFEQSYFDNIMRRNKGAVNRTAREIKISKTTLITKLRKYAINYRVVAKNSKIQVA